jgi:hypothetical protein
MPLAADGDGESGHSDEMTTEPRGYITCETAGQMKSNAAN